MSLLHSPSIVTNGLVFAYDMANTKKSWKGAPVTNYMPYPYASYNAGAFVLGYNYANLGATYTYVTGVDNPVNAPGVMEYYTGTSGYKYFSVDSTTLPTTGTYTFSYYARIKSAGDTSMRPIDSQLWRANGSDRSVTGDWNPTFTTEWKRYATTGPAEASTILQYFPVHSGNIIGGYTIQYCGFQLELGSVATPFVSGTRSSTNNITDLTGRSTVTTGALTYNSDNTFNFDYTGPGYVSVPLSTSFNKTEGTINIWVYPTRYNGGNGYFVNREDSTPNAVDWLWIGPYSDTFYFRIGDGSSCCSNDLAFGSFSTVVPLNTWTNMCFTWKSNGTSVIYKNGVQYTSRAISTIPATNPATNGRFGLGHANADAYYNGKMPVAQIYNRQLTSEEILSNFNAMRGRYGI